ncbi:hypothetical protein [Sorangium sp. So ce542]
MRFFIPAFSRDDGHALLFKLGLPAGAADGLGDPLVLAMLLETASRSHLR